MREYNKLAFQGIQSIPEDELEKARLFYWSEFQCGWSKEPQTERTQWLSFFKNIFTQYSIPEKGFFIMLGSFDCEVLDSWCDLFGSQRCIGYDIENPKKHPNVRVQDIRSIESESIPSALVWNDCGYWFLNPQTNLSGLKFAIKNVIVGGFYLSRSDQSSGMGLSLILKKNGFSPIFEHPSVTLYQRINYGSHKR